MKYNMDDIKKYLMNLRRPFLLAELTAKFGFGKSTAFRILKKLNILTSVNSRAQYYIYPFCIKFNRYGLYTAEGKCFSRFGNLLNTITALVNQSSKGITSGRISDLVGTNVQLQLRDLSKAEKVFRKRIGKEYVYFSVDTGKRAKQLKRVKPKSETVVTELNHEPHEFLVDTIKILTAYIQNPSFSPKSIALSLCRRGEDIRTEKVKLVLEKFNIAKKNC
jgi:hypothetical protein